MTEFYFSLSYRLFGLWEKSQIRTYDGLLYKQYLLPINQSLSTLTLTLTLTLNTCRLQSTLDPTANC